MENQVLQMTYSVGENSRSAFQCGSTASAKVSQSQEMGGFSSMSEFDAKELERKIKLVLAGHRPG